MNVPAMIIKYSLKPTGVIQAGSHHGEEIPIWDALRIPHVHFEPIQYNYDKLISLYPKTDAYMIALGNKRGGATMFTEQVNGGQSCSLLKPLRHKEILAWIDFSGTEEVLICQLDSLNIPSIAPCNFMYVDVQGYELEVFRGAKETIKKQIDFIFTEVNRTQVYEGCAQVEDLDVFLGELGLTRVETEWHGGEFGDALYVRNELL